MIRIFRHHMSLRALVLAISELLVFVAIYHFSRVFVFPLLYPIDGTSGHAVILPAYCVVASGVAYACGIYDKHHNTDHNFTKLIVISALMYLSMALFLWIDSLVRGGFGILEPYLAITLMTTVAYVVAAFLFRQNALKFTSRKLPGHRVLVVGVGECASKIVNLIRTSRSRYSIVGFVAVRDEAPFPGFPEDKLLTADLLTKSALHVEARRLRADEIVVASRERRGLPVDALMECKLRGIPVSEFAGFWERHTCQIDLDDLNPSWLIFCDGFRITRLSNLVKRTFDVVVSLMVLIVTLPITAAAALAIKLDSPGSLFYRQERVGLDGEIFSILKFRSMRPDAEKDGIARWSQTNDCRVTRVGRFLRRSRIDEIPQVINVLAGKMSFVGPRPERPSFVESLSQKIPYYGIRHRVKPGITGWAQVNFPYGSSDEDAKSKLAYDLYYSKNQSVLLDFVILLKTIRVVLWPEDAADVASSYRHKIMVVTPRISAT